MSDLQYVHRPGMARLLIEQAFEGLSESERITVAAKLDAVKRILRLKRGDLAMAACLFGEVLQLVGLYLPAPPPPPETEP